MKKYIFIFITISVVVFLYNIVSFNNTSPSIGMIISASSLKNPEIVKNIEKELSKIKGVSSYEVSLESSQFLINYDSKHVNKKDIVGILKKWGCEPLEISFNPIIFNETY